MASGMRQSALVTARARRSSTALLHPAASLVIRIFTRFDVLETRLFRQTPGRKMILTVGLLQPLGQAAARRRRLSAREGADARRVALHRIYVAGTWPVFDDPSAGTAFPSGHHCLFTVKTRRLTDADKQPLDSDGTCTEHTQSTNTADHVRRSRHDSRASHPESHRLEQPIAGRNNRDPAVSLAHCRRRKPARPGNRRKKMGTIRRGAIQEHCGRTSQEGRSGGG